MTVDADKPTEGAVRRVSRRVSFGAMLVVLSFIVYASTVFSLPQVRDTRICCEQSGLAAAVSNTLYGAPLGSLYSGVFDFFIDRFSDPIATTLEAAGSLGGPLPATPPGAWWPTTRDGNGIGYPLVATAALRLFGLHAWALPLTMLILMAIAAITLLCRFSLVFASVVILYFSALTIMLFTPLVWDPAYAVNIPVGGIRYFSLVSILPIFHILLTLQDRRPSGAGHSLRDALLLAVQTMILVLAILVRGSALSLVGAIALVALALAWRYRRGSQRRLKLLRDCTLIGLVSIGLVAGIILSIPRQYITDGRFGTVIWQRVTESLGTNPAWPFPGVNDMFDCKKYINEGIVIGTSDSNGACIWYDYVTRHGIPVETLGDKTFGTYYERALREAFFKIAARYPGEVLKTFVYDKPATIRSSITDSMRLNIEGDPAKTVVPKGRQPIPYSALAVGVLIAALVAPLFYFGVAAVPMAEVGHVAQVAVLSALFTIPSYIAAWAKPHTSGDLLLYCLFLFGLALGAIVLWVRSTARRWLAAGVR